MPPISEVHQKEIAEHHFSSPLTGPKRAMQIYSDRLTSQANHLGSDELLAAELKDATARSSVSPDIFDSDSEGDEKLSASEQTAAAPPLEFAKLFEGEPPPELTPEEISSLNDIYSRNRRSNSSSSDMSIGGRRKTRKKRKTRKRKEKLEKRKGKQEKSEKEEEN